VNLSIIYVYVRTYQPNTDLQRIEPMDGNGCSKFAHTYLRCVREFFRL